MSINDNVIALTDEVYASKKELPRYLGTNMVEGFWEQIQQYRASLRNGLGITTIAGKELYYTGSVGINAKIDALRQKCEALASKVNAIKIAEQGAESKKELILDTMHGAFAFSKSSLRMSDSSLNALLDGYYREKNPDHSFGLAYHSIVDSKIKEHGFQNVGGIDLAAYYYQILLRTEDLTAFYRTKDFDGKAKQAQYSIAQDYPYSPYERIDALMEPFWSFYDSEFDPFIRALATLYYFDYVKPFNSHNDALGSLLAKSIISGVPSIGGLAFVLPLEWTLAGDGDFASVFNEVQRTGDITYFFVYAIDVVDKRIDYLMDRLGEIYISQYSSENRSFTESEEREIAERGSLIQGSLFDTISIRTPRMTGVSPQGDDEGKEPSPEEKEGPAGPLFQESEVARSEESPHVYEEPAAPEEPTPEEPVAERGAEASPAPRPSPAEKAPIPKKEAPKVERISKEEMNASQSEGLSLSLDSSQMSPKAVKEYTQYLLEIDPELNRAQASFLANHCQMGRYYTIQQYKKFNRCAYETARTSMDKLAAGHYYKKLAVKNKFVYTPVKQEEK